MRKWLLRAIATVLSLIAVLWGPAKHLFASLMWLIGLAGLPGDLDAWEQAMTMYDINIWGPWLLLALAIGILLQTTTWPARGWKYIKAGLIDKRQVDDAISHTINSPDLALIFRMQKPFWNQCATMTASRELVCVKRECLIGVRNISDKTLDNIKVQVTACTSPISEIPITLRRRDNGCVPFALQPNEIILILLASRENRRDGTAPRVTIHGKDEDIMVLSKKISIRIEAFGRDANIGETFDLSIDDDGDLNISPVALGEHFKAFDRDVFLDIKVRPG